MAALPVGIYRKYKASTDFFKRWLLSVGLSIGVAARDHSLEGYARIVRAVARDPLQLPPAQLHLWPRALAACESAITLRERAALFFPAQPNDSHAHFLCRLKEWHELLQRATQPVLALPDDYFDADDEEALAVPALKPAKSGRTAAQRKKLADDGFAEDLNAELACLIMELEELCESVYAAYFEIKREKSTLLQATTVAKVAIDSAAHVIAKLQLKYSAIRNGPDLIHLLEDRIPYKAREQLQRDMILNWSHRGEDATYQYVPGALLADFLWLGQVLHAWGNKVIPTHPESSFLTRVSATSEPYDEDATPHYTDPDPTMPPHFLQQQLPHLYNAFVFNGEVKNTTTSLTMWFVSHFDEFFKTRVPSIHLVFVCACWVRAVAALQGNRYLSRSVSLSIMHRWELEDNLRHFISKGTVRRADPTLHAEMETAFKNMVSCDNTFLLTRANPIFAGCQLFDNQFKYLDLGTDAILVKSHFRAFCHIYNALRDRRLIDTIPFIEDALRVYEPAMFTPSREAATQGSFFRAYLVSSHVTDAAIDAILGQRGAVPQQFTTRVRRHFRLPDLVATYRLLVNRDLSVLPNGSITSWTTLLNAAKQLCTKELFDTRVLSRDMLKLSEDLNDLFENVCDALGRRADAERRLAEGYPNQDRQYALNRAVEDSVVIPLLPLLGCLNVDGSTRVSEDSKFCVRLESMRDLGEVIDGPVIVAYARKAVEVITQMFLDPDPDQIEHTYFAFEKTPDWVLVVFETFYGDNEDVEAQPKPELFADLMEMLRTSNGPLRGDDLLRLKNAIVAHPEILEMTTKDELCSLYHHAAGGPARDRYLVEWMTQMGALDAQPMHCRWRTAPHIVAAQGTRHFCNDLAVHSAARVGEMEIVRLILEYERCYDIDTVTFHTRESLAHIAVQHGHRQLFELLKAFSADMTQKNSEGKFVYDLTTDAEWKRSIVELAVGQRRQQAEKQRNRPTATSATFRQQNERAADKLRRDLMEQRDAAHGRNSTSTQIARGGSRLGQSSESSEGPSRGREAAGRTTSSKKKKKNKPNQPKQTNEQAPSADDEVEGNLLERLRLERDIDEFPESEFELSFDPTMDRTQSLAKNFQVLKESSGASAEERDSSAMMAWCCIRSICETMQKSVAANAMIARNATTEKHAVEAHAAFLQLNKYYRQLPTPRKPLECRCADLFRLQLVGGDDFALFLSFAVNTSTVLVACGRVAQAREVLDVVERRLVRMARADQPTEQLPKYVRLFTEAREHAKLDPLAVETQQVLQQVMEGL